MNPSDASDDQARDDALVAGLRRGDEDAFVALLERYHATLRRLALIYVHDPSTADDVVQETWLAVLRGIAGFAGRASLKTWLCHILINQAKRRAKRDGRIIPFAMVEGAEEGGPSVDPERFLPLDHRWAGHWADPPEAWPEQWVLTSEALACVKQAVAGLPPNQRLVITLRDIEGWSAQEVCNVLQISDTNQRVLLHRARSSVRRALEAEFERG